MVVEPDGSEPEFAAADGAALHVAAADGAAGPAAGAGGADIDGPTEVAEAAVPPQPGMAGLQCAERGKLFSTLRGLKCHGTHAPAAKGLRQLL